MDFTQVHVSGLPADCGEDADVEKALQRSMPLATAEDTSAPMSPAAPMSDVEVEAADASEQPSATEDARYAANILQCVVVRNKETGECKGYCFLSFQSTAEAEIAMNALNAGVTVAGCEVKAALSKPKERPKTAERRTGQEDDRDLPLHRKRYSPAGKHDNLHTCSDKSKLRTQNGKMAGPGGTRGQFRELRPK
eukprot:gnl/TRDRNA2_/TRDRNA2_187413_c0_seq1.p1 gnl/TRDRNA2_/TRDRNA2_187413_c0~~gnl/TRDRNA2_/TRDRNA2_187413_c0_seq1.p1  ORF type:complete len:208 (+),score=30.42 gnl/TRDRNA2_/TRDRNA2_187413_c0_seq1:43-624(+)